MPDILRLRNLERTYCQVNAYREKHADSTMSDRKLILVMGILALRALPLSRVRRIPDGIARNSSLTWRMIALSSSGRYDVRVLTRNTASEQARKMVVLPQVTLQQGFQETRQISTLPSPAYTAPGRLYARGKSELIYGIRAYEIARHHGVKHYVFANIDYTLRKAGWDEQYHCAHCDSKADW
jgi:hypothetical protein